MTSPADGGRIRLAVVSDGPHDDPRTNSGVVLSLTEALQGLPSGPEVHPVDCSLTPVQRAVVLGLAFRINRSSWRRSYRKHPLNIALRSWNRDRQLRRLDVDHVLQVRGYMTPPKQPFSVFVDTTASLSQSWPAWRLGPIAHRYRMTIERKQFATAQHVFTTGRQVADSVAQSYGVPEARLTVLGAGVNYEMPAEESLTKKAVRRILFVGYDFDRKGGRELIQAFTSLIDEFPDAHVDVVGPPAPTAATPNTTWRGPLPRSEVRKLYESASIFCLPALHEPFGLVFLEAMAYGLACIGSRTGSIPDIIAEGHTGLLVRPGDVTALRACMEQLLADPQLASAMGAAGRKRVQTEFSWNIVAGRLYDRLTDVSSSRTTPPPAPQR